MQRNDTGSCNLLQLQRVAAPLLRYAKINGLPGDIGPPYIIKDGVYRFEAIELVRCVYGDDCDRNDGRWKWRTYGLADPIVNAEHIMCHFPGIGKSTCPGLTFNGVLSLLIVLPSSAAPVKRLLIKNFERYIAGDPLLHAEIVANTLSTAPINLAARASMQCETSNHAENVETEGVVVQRFEKMMAVDLGDCLDRLYAKWDNDEACLMQKAESSGKAFLGNCYACWNPLFPGLIKIGWTGRSPMQRVRELSGTGVPEPFQLLSCINCYNPQDIEKQIHAYFAADRKYGKKKEFFLTSMLAVDNYFEWLKRKLAGVVVPAAHVREPKRKLEDILMDRMASFEERFETRLDTLIKALSPTLLDSSVPSTAAADSASCS